MVFKIKNKRKHKNSFSTKRQIKKILMSVPNLKCQAHEVTKL